MSICIVFKIRVDRARSAAVVFYLVDKRLETEKAAMHGKFDTDTIHILHMGVDSSVAQSLFFLGLSEGLKTYTCTTTDLAMEALEQTEPTIIIVDQSVVDEEFRKIKSIKEYFFSASILMRVV